MITFDDIVKRTKEASILESERKSRMELHNLKKEILAKIVENVQAREQHFGNISIGNIIESNEERYEVVKVESSYVNVVDNIGNLHVKWLADVDSVISESTDMDFVLREGTQVSYKGYLSKNLDPELVENIVGKKFNPYIMLNFLHKYDEMMERHEPRKQKRIVEQVMKYAMKLQLSFDSNIQAHDDWMIYEAAQGNIKYNTPSVKKIKAILETLDINKYKDNIIISNLQEMIRS